jgi:hypothetical protein
MAIYESANAVARQRLQRLIAHLDDDALARPLPHGWTVATALAHMAFWDQRALAALTSWEAHGIAPTAGDDTINAAVEALAQALPPRATVQLALSSAEAVDGKIDHLAPDLVATIIAAGLERFLYRARHRNEHLAELEQTMGLADAA